MGLHPNNGAGLAPITPEDWAVIAAGLHYLWLWAGGAVVAALAFLVAQGMIPSLLATESIPRRLGIIRPFGYAVTALALAVGIYGLVRLALIYAAVFLHVYPRFVI
ncbi:MAG TPA: hypothetical protein VK066_00090 [Chloroflexota bacterium]|nr:hypothetical protein [Chloroflexota bacterium]